MTRTVFLVAAVLLVVTGSAGAGDLEFNTWEKTTDFPVLGWQYDPVEHNGFIYVVGGIGFDPDTCGSGQCAFDSVYYAAVNPDSSLGSWSETTSLPEPDQAPQVAAWEGYLYALLRNGNVYWTQIDSNDGGLGPWQGPTIADPYRGAALVAYGGYLYVLGGFGDGQGGCFMYDDVYVAEIGQQGVPGSWENTTPMEVRQEWMSVHFYNDRAYIVGGISGCGGPILNTSWSAPVGGDGMLGAWTPEAELPHSLWYHSSILIDNQIYLIGGRVNFNGTQQSLNIYEGAIDPCDGVISEWIDVGDLPDDFVSGLGAVYSPAVSEVYLIGGANPSTPTANVWTTADICPADFNNDGIVDAADLAMLLGSWGPCD